MLQDQDDLIPATRRFGLVLLTILMVCACTPLPPPCPPTPPAACPPALPVATLPALLPAPGPEGPRVPPLEPVSWEEIDGWEDQDPTPALEAFREGCQVLAARPQWQSVCAAAADFTPVDAASVRAFFEARFLPQRVRKPDGSTTGLITGYYVPNLRGSRTRSDRYAWPIYGVPDDLLIIDLRSVYPDLANYRLRGRLEGRRVVPYYSRGQLDAGNHLDGTELLWVEDPVELFFMQIQGSGRILLENGEALLVHYADQNGHPFRSIGKLLIERGEMTRDQMSMQNIRAWAREHPDQTAALLAENPSYVFFTELPARVDRPYGALGVKLTAERSLAVDPRTIPLGSPVFLSTTWPSSSKPLRRLMVAQDTGGAIKGPVRGDFYWGIGDEPGAYAGRMKQKCRLWVFLPFQGLP